MIKKYLILSITVFLVSGSYSVVLAAKSKGSNIARAFFSTAIVNREPVNRLLVGSELKKVYFFSEVRHMEGQTIYHRWEYNDKVVSKKKFNVKNAKWRAYSSYKIKPNMIGKWTVVVTDERGWPLKAVIFHYVKRQSQTDYPDVILPPK
ncbi:MAG: DUF2914 domain-containing protein [Gammaproteobacteria bacterium]